jgi:hypothetical protein
MKALIAFFLPFLTVSTIVSDTGCYCALKKNAISTPWVNASVSLGCSYRVDWTGSTSKWCLTDQTAATCGRNETGFGMVDSCAGAGFTNFFLAPSISLDATQGNRTFYTGQTLSMNWTTQNILPDENLTITFMTRTLSPTLGVPSATGFYQARISDSGTSVTSGAAVILQTVSSPQVNLSSPAIAVIQSKIANLVLYNNVTLMSSGTSVVCDGRNITVVWQGIGEASVGIASVTLRSTGGGGGGGGGTTVGTASTGLAAQANMSVGYPCPRGQTIPGFGNTFAAYISVQSPGVGVAPYTLTSPTTFSLVAAATPSPTGTATPSSTPTPTPSLSTGATASNTPSSTPTSSSTPTPSTTATGSATPTISITSSASVTASSSKTPAASIDLAAVAAQAQAASMSALGQILGGIFGSIGAICVASFGYYVYQRRQLRVQRLRRNQISVKRLEQSRSVYGVQNNQPNHIQTVVMYQQGRTRR